MNTSTIQTLLAGIERQHQVTILHACESGSRAWGFASSDSDYDIRFLFVRAESSYLSLRDYPDTIELPLEGALDAGGWDVKKAARLLAKSNGALVEWLHSPIIYRNNPDFLARWRSAAHRVFSARASVDHYRGLAKQMVKGKLDGPDARAKDYLYALRAILCANWVADGKGIPPVAFAEVLPFAPPTIQAMVARLMAAKLTTREGDRIPRLPALDAYLVEMLAHLESRLADLPATDDPQAILDPLLRCEIRSRRSVTSMRKSDFNLDRVKDPDLLLFETVAGSRAYGTNVAGSDEDRRGVFVAPVDFLLGLESIEQVADDRGDVVYYEIGRLVELLACNNPNALELLAMPEDCIRHQDEAYSLLRPQDFLSKLCARTFGEYALGQIRKARGLNKKIVNPEPEQRRSLMDFCHVPTGQGSMPVLAWLEKEEIDPRHCGLTAVAHAAGLFALYVGLPGQYRGLLSPKDPNVLLFSSVPHDARPVAWMHANMDAYKAHCRAHSAYWNWVSTRNEERYMTNSSHGRGYDSKNVMHTFRLLEMAEDIAREGILRVRRPNPEFLLKIRAGKFSFDELITRAEEVHDRVQSAFLAADLPDRPDEQTINARLVELRHVFATSHQV